MNIISKELKILNEDLNHILIVSQIASYYIIIMIELSLKNYMSNQVNMI
jgi:hypothetical protein